MKRFLLLTAACFLLAACSDGRSYDQAIAVLIDVSGTYADEKPEVVRILKRDVLPEMVPGDTLIVIKIDSKSYEKDNLVALLTLDSRPSKSNAQKLALAKALDDFARSDVRSQYTDIPGAMMLATEYLRERQAGSRVMLVFSDMAEDLPKGTRRKLGDTEFEGIRVVAMNVKRLEGDSADPEVFRGRLAGWEKRVTESGALGWENFMDSTKLAAYLAQVR